MRKTPDSTDIYLADKLKEYQLRLAREQKILRKMPEGKLLVQKNRAGFQFIHETNKSGYGEKDCRIRTSIGKDKNMIYKLARKKSLEISTDLLLHEIDTIKRHLKKHVEPSYSNILSMLPKHMQSLPLEAFFPELKMHRDWASADYKINTYKNEEKIHITSRGQRMRSKSEVFIAEKLYQFGIPFRYDELIYFEGRWYSPDFTFPEINGKKWYWEHCGMMSDLFYRSDNQRKIAQYERMGITPWDNLIITYDTVDGGINLAVIESEIKSKLII